MICVIDEMKKTIMRIETSSVFFKDINTTRVNQMMSTWGTNCSIEEHSK